MKKQLITLALCKLLSFSAFGQDIHTPAEIFKIMEESEVSYEIHMLEEEIPAPDRSNKINFNEFYRVSNDKGMSTYKYKVEGELQEVLKKAESFFMSGKYAQAREMYIKALEVDSSYYQAMTFVGQTYGIEKDFDKAIEWYENTISLNYIDYMAHWFLADAYRSKGDWDKALDEITIAMILNRNNPRIKLSFDEIYKRKKLKTDEWTFTPQMQIDSVGPNKVKIAFHSDWTGYAMVKAVWLYEPGYKESMGVTEGSISTLEEKEAFLALLTTLDKKKIKKIPEFKALQLSLDKEMITEYIFYEIILPEHPFVAYQLSEEFVGNIKDYVIQVRGKQK